MAWFRSTDFRLGFCCLLLLGMSSCGGGGAGSTSIVITPPAPIPTPVPKAAAPVIAAISPFSSPTGSLSLVDVYGSGFAPGSQVLVDSTPRLTTVLSSSEVDFAMDAALSSVPAVHQITVQASGQVSNAVTLSIYAPGQGPVPFAANPGYYASDAGDFGPVAVADLDGDGLVDVVASSFGNLFCLHGNSNGSLGPRQALNFSGTPLAAGDVNNDGAADLLIVDANNKLAMLLNNRQGGFTQGPEFPLPGDFPGGPPRILDMNGDGLADLVISTNNPSPALTLFLNQGGGTFNTGLTLASLTGGTLDFAIADLNGDGQPDILYTSVNPTTGAAEIHLLLNQGNGKFQDTVPAALHGLSGQITVGDFDLDGSPDVAVQSASNSGLVLNIFLNQSGTLHLASTTTIGPAGFAPYHLLVGDFDHDGYPDLAGVNGETEPSHVLFLWGDGRGDFSPQPVVGPMGFTAAMGDVNGDGIPDLVVPDRFNEVSLVLGRHDRNFLSPVSLTPTFAGSISAADVNHDGYPDLLIGGFGVYGIPGSLFINHGDGTFSAPIAEPANAFLLGDLNNDGYADLVGTNGSDIVIWPGDGSGTFGSASPITIQAGLTAPQVTLYDLDGDGRLDLITSTAVFYGRGNFQFDALPIPGISSFIIADVNGDGRPDIVGTGTVLLATGPRSFQSVNTTVPIGASSGALFAAGDFDGDGKIDLAISLGAGISICYGLGDGTFSAGTGVNTQTNVTTLAAGDFNRDGKTDLVAGTTGPHQAMVFTNAGVGRFDVSYFASGAYATNMLAIDLNHDGKLDLVVVNFLLNYRPANVEVIFGR